MILCDIDGVLATAIGQDTTPGEEIYRTFLEPLDELARIQADGIPLHVVTAKIEAEAWQVLRAVRLENAFTSLIGAEKLFWPTIMSNARRGRLPRSLSKVGFRQYVPATGDSPVVMIEDRVEHLRDMLHSGVIDFGILVPGMSFVDGYVTEWFDLNLALGVARRLVQSQISADELFRLGLTAHAWDDDQLVPVGVLGHDSPDQELSLLFSLPQIPYTLEGSSDRGTHSLRTGQVLMSGPQSLVTLIRRSRRLARSLGRRPSGS